MKTLTGLCFRVRKFLTQTFKHGVEDHYKKVHGSNCSRSLSYCRDLCFLPHLLKVKLSWKDITVQDFAVAFNIDATLLMNDEQRILALTDVNCTCSVMFIGGTSLYIYMYISACVYIHMCFPKTFWLKVAFIAFYVAF